MTVRGRQVTYVAVLVGAMVVSSQAVTAQAWEALLGAGPGAAMARFWALQVESYTFAVLVPFVFSGVYGLHRDATGRWQVRPDRRRRVAAYGLLVLACLVCSAEGPVRSLLEVPLPDDVAASLALYLRRALEGVAAMVGIMAFLDLVRPGPFARPLA